MSKGVEAGKAYVSLGVNAQALEKGLKKASKKVSAVGKKISLAGAGIAGAGASILGPLLAATNAFAESGNKLQKMSLRTGTSVESLSALAFAAEQSGTSIDQVGDAMFRTSRRIANAAKTGAGPAARALGILGVDLDKLNSMTADEQFLALADALGSVEDEALANQLGFEILGDSFKQIKPLMDQGSDGIRKLMTEAGELGRTMSTEDANAAAEFGDAMNRVSSVVKGVTMQIGAALAPAITEIAGKISEGAKTVLEFVRNNKSLIVTVAKVAAIVIGVGTAIGFLGGLLVTIGAGIAALGTVVGAIGATIAAVFSPVGLIILGVAAAIGAAVVALEHYFGFVSAGVKWLGKAFGVVKEIFNKTFGVIVQEIKAGNLQVAFGIAADAIELIWLELGENLMAYFDNVLVSMGESFDKFLKRAIGIARALALVFQSSLGAIDGVLDIDLVSNVESAIKSIAGVSQALTQNIGDPEKRAADRERRRQELRARMDARAAAQAGKEPKEKADGIFDELEKLNVNLDVDFGKKVKKPKPALSDSVGGTFSVFAAQALGAYRWEERMLKVAEKNMQANVEVVKKLDNQQSNFQ